MYVFIDCCLIVLPQIVCSVAVHARYWGPVSCLAEGIQWDHSTTLAASIWWTRAGGRTNWGYHNEPKFYDRQVCANSVDSDQTSPQKYETLNGTLKQTFYVLIFNKFGTNYEFTISAAEVIQSKRMHMSHDTTKSGVFGSFRPGQT